MRKILVSAAMALVLSTGAVQASSDGPTLQERDWPWLGMFGTFDRAQLRRGFQVYREVCASCHSLDLIAFRNLADLGFTGDDIKALAAEYEVPAGPDDDGETHDEDGSPLMRTALPSDYFPAPFANDKAAQAANSGTIPPDLSLITKARPQGLDYMYSLLVRSYEDQVSEETLQEIFAIENHKLHVKYAADLEAYEAKIAAGKEAKKPEEPEAIETVDGLGLAEGKSFNAFFKGYAISMPPPLYDEAVEYEDGTETTTDQHAQDVIAFLAWSAQPELETRKRIGLAVMIFLVVMSAMLLALKRQIWSDVH